MGVGKAFAETGYETFANTFGQQTIYPAEAIVT
jgi:hypothetical protein